MSLFGFLLNEVKQIISPIEEVKSKDRGFSQEYKDMVKRKDEEFEPDDIRFLTKGGLLSEGRRAEDSILKFAVDTDWFNVVRGERFRLNSNHHRRLNGTNEQIEEFDQARDNLARLESGIKYATNLNQKDKAWEEYKKCTSNIEDSTMTFAGNLAWGNVVREEKRIFKSKNESIRNKIKAEKIQAWAEWYKLKTNLKSAANLEEKDQAWEEYKKAVPFIKRPSSEEADLALEMDRKGMGKCVDCKKYTSNRYAWWIHRDQVTQVLGDQGQLKSFLCLDCLRTYKPIVTTTQIEDGVETTTKWDPAGEALKKALEEQKLNDN